LIHRVAAIHTGQPIGDVKSPVHGPGVKLYPNVIDGVLPSHHSSNAGNIFEIGGASSVGDTSFVANTSDALTNEAVCSYGHPVDSAHAAFVWIIRTTTNILTQIPVVVRCPGITTAYAAEIDQINGNDLLVDEFLDRQSRHRCAVLNSYRVSSVSGSAGLMVRSWLSPEAIETVIS
jgi:hypothetical protein